ncbi:hypothetical protein FACS1894199_06640 [Bacteroidia bacterium]|nr:hypothetical protein FACS1894199_06640 [Bacteroidia bacterium]
MKQPKSVAKCNCKAFDKHAEFQHEEHKIVTFKDKGTSEYKYTNKSSNHLAKYIVDGKLIADKGAKCDFLLLNCEQKQSYFIELKGSDMIRAIEQIDRSIDLLKPNLADFAFFARIVLTKVATIDSKSTKLVKLEKKLKSLKGNLKKQTRLLQEVV